MAWQTLDPTGRQNGEVARVPLNVNRITHIEKGLNSLLEHTDRLEQQLEQHGPGQASVTLALTDDRFLRSSNWARWQLGNPLPGKD